MNNDYVGTGADIDFDARRKAAIKAVAIGNFVEWYDFVLYGLFSTTLAAVFFPKSSATAGLLATFAILGVSFLARPLGGLLFGQIGDRLGRKQALLISVLVMSGATVVVGLLPGAAQIGILAPLLLLVCRLAQAVAAGGEYGPSTSYIVEFAPPDKRGRFASIVPAWNYIGCFAGVLVSLTVTLSVTPEDLLSWGWRIPFLIAAPLGLVGLYLRMRMEESPVFEALRETGTVEKTPLREALRSSKKPLLIIIGWAMTNATAAYIMSTYLVSHMSAKASFGVANAFVVQLVLWTVLTVGTLVAGRLIDRVGRKTVAVTCATAMTIIAVPAVALLENSSLTQSIVIVFVVAVFYAGFTATTALAMVELLPPAIRATGAAISFQIAYAVFGGTAPILATWWVSMGWSLAPGMYLAGLSAVSTVVAALWIGNRAGSTEQDEDPVRPHVEPCESVDPVM
jgi:MHS family proline/betaine transporter-like MFS transporter